jgi:chromosome segregation ATPase
MEAAFSTAVTVATRAADAWQRLLPAAADAAAALDNVRALTRAAGGNATTLDDADRRLTAFTSRLATDPLGVDENDLSGVRTLIARADAERTSAAELREALTQRLADAHRLAHEVAEARRAAQAAEDAAAGRFADADIATVRGGDLRPDLAAIDALAAAGHWALLSSRLSEWSRRARELAAELRAAAARNTAMLAERNELRGRLDAYQAKALRRGLGESDDLTPLADAARTVLHTAPCDLSAARVAVNAYQDALTATIARDGR